MKLTKDHMIRLLAVVAFAGSFGCHRAPEQSVVESGSPTPMMTTDDTYVTGSAENLDEAEVAPRTVTSRRSIAAGEMAPDPDAVQAPAPRRSSDVAMDWDLEDEDIADADVYETDEEFIRAPASVVATDQALIGSWRLSYPGGYKTDDLKATQEERASLREPASTFEGASAPRLLINYPGGYK